MKTLAEYFKEGLSASDFHLCNNCEDCEHRAGIPARINCAAEDAYPGEEWCNRDEDFFYIDSLDDLIDCLGAENIDVDDDEETISCPSYRMYYEYEEDEERYYYGL